MDPNWATKLGDFSWANVGKLFSSTMGRIWEKFCGTFWGNQTAKTRREFTMGFKHHEWAESFEPSAVADLDDRNS